MNVVTVDLFAHTTIRCLIEHVQRANYKAGYVCITMINIPHNKVGASQDLMVELGKFCRANLLKPAKYVWNFSVVGAPKAAKETASARKLFPSTDVLVLANNFTNILTVSV